MEPESERGGSPSVSSPRLASVLSLCYIPSSFNPSHKVHHCTGDVTQVGTPTVPGTTTSCEHEHPYLPRYPNIRKRMQNMMHVTPMWIPMMMPVVEVLLFCSSFMQSQGGFSTARKRRRGQWCYSSIAPLAFGEPRAKVRALGSAGSCVWEEENHKGSRSSLPAYAAPLLPAWETQQAQDWNICSEPAPLPGYCHETQLMQKTHSDVNFCNATCSGGR